MKESVKLSGRKFLDEIEGKNLNFLIGAGASIDSVGSLSIPGDKKISFEDLYNMKTDENTRAFLKFIFFYKSIKNGLITKFSKDDDNSKKTCANYVRFINHVLNLLIHSGFERPKRANIFTTNYDTFFELAFDQISIENPLAYFNDGSRGFFTREISYQNYYFNISHSSSMDTYRREIPSVNLYKMHGSLSWEKVSKDKLNSNNINTSDEIIVSTDKNQIYKNLTNLGAKIICALKTFCNDVPSDLKSSKDCKKLIDSIKKSEDVISKIIDCLSNPKLITELVNLFTSNSKDKSDINQSEMLNQFAKLYDELQIINPSFKKYEETVINRQSYQLLRAFENEMQQPNTALIAFGFSFHDKHINEILERSLTNPSLELYIIPFSEEDETYVNKLFIKYNNLTILKCYDDKNNRLKGNFDVLNGFLSGKYEING